MSEQEIVKALRHCTGELTVGGDRCAGCPADVRKTRRRGCGFVMIEAADVIERLTRERDVLQYDRDTLMKRRKEQIEVIRTRIDKDGLCDVEKRLLNDLNLPSDYDRRPTAARRERRRF